MPCHIAGQAEFGARVNRTRWLDMTPVDLMHPPIDFLEGTVEMILRTLDCCFLNGSGPLGLRRD